ncbi:MAG TPA: hypothetical protein EYN06_07860 [Myxococcales bacterium]|nr:hypothetical protein [Myxococcales bacterium]HIN86380.1 hypothetical protein [Myxococcales bacterium]
MNRFAHLCIVTLILCAGTMGCAEDEFFNPCPFDKTIEKVCDTETEDGQLTCVVKTHPQCMKDICIGYRGHDGVCSQTCSPDSNNCPGDSSCITYNELTLEYYCVPNSHL